MTSLQAGVLATNGYLRLDPNALHYAIYAAGESQTSYPRHKSIVHLVYALETLTFTYPKCDPALDKMSFPSPKT